MPERLSEKDAEPNSCRAAAGCPIAHSYPPPPAEALKCPARKPQNVSAFALTYSLRRSGKRMGAFIIHPCLPVSERKCKQQGPFAPRTLLRFTATMSPSATLSSLHRFPGFASYTVCCSGNFSSGREGFSSCARILVIVLPLTPRQSVSPLQSVAAIHVAFALSVRARPLEFSVFEATYAFTFVAAR